MAGLRGDFLHFWRKKWRCFFPLAGYLLVVLFSTLCKLMKLEHLLRTCLMPYLLQTVLA